jgi:hypothetical protein
MVLIERKITIEGITIEISPHPDSTGAESDKFRVTIKSRSALIQNHQISNFLGFSVVGAKKIQSLCAAFAALGADQAAS